MAGDWIKMRTSLPSERAVMSICDSTGLDPFAVVGRLHAIWSWADAHTVTGDVTGVTLATVDRVTACAGFGSAMMRAEWLEELPNGGIRFPRWKIHNHKSSKSRVLEAKRARDYRQRKRDAERDDERDASVTNHATTGEDRTGEVLSRSNACERAKPPGQWNPDSWDDVFHACQRWKGAGITSSEEGFLRQFVDAVEAMPVEIGGQPASHHAIVAMAIGNAIESQAAYATIHRALKYLGQIVERCRRDGCWPGQFAPKPASDRDARRTAVEAEEARITANRRREAEQLRNERQAWEAQRAAQQAAKGASRA